jgi:hypothetical protein
MALNPKVLAGWVALQTNLAHTVDIRTRDAIALAVSRKSTIAPTVGRPTRTEP